MSEEQNSKIIGERKNIRQEMVTTAKNFLLNPSIINQPYGQKVNFLREKGLTGYEIAAAFAAAKSDPSYNQLVSSNTSNTPPVPPPVGVPGGYLVPMYGRPPSFWVKLSRFSSSLIVLGVAIFGAHYVYKNYIEPLIFGDVNHSESQNLEKQLLKLTNSVTQLEKQISALVEIMSNQKMQMDKFLQNEYSEYYPTPLALRELKSDVASVKSLLLNRHQFPALPKITSPSIPQWQLHSNKSDDASEENGEASEKSHSDEENSVTKHNGDLLQHLDKNCYTAEHKDKDGAIGSVEVKSVQSEHSEALENSFPLS